MDELLPKEATQFVDTFADGGAKRERAAILEMVRERAKEAWRLSAKDKIAPEQFAANGDALDQLAADIEARGDG